MSESVPQPGSRAVFLSYTSEDRAVALALCEALREGGVEVWMDQSELQGGDAWDEHIRRQLRECALIIPIISARTQARHEGYFRLEWKLADERSHLVAEGKPLIVPVVADDTQQKEALVPKSFLTVQWTRLPHGIVPPAFVTRVRRLLGLETGSTSPTQAPMTVPATARLELLEPPATGIARHADRTERTPLPTGRRILPLAAGVVLGAVVAALAVWQLKPVPPSPARGVSRWVYEIPPDQNMRSTLNLRLGVSPDGRSFVYSTSKGMFLRQLGELEARLIPGSDTENGLSYPTFSPDGQYLGYLSGGTTPGLKRIQIRGGLATTIVPTGRGGTPFWSEDGMIVYGGRGGAGIQSVPVAGGVPKVLVTAASTENISYPQPLPGGDLILFNLSRNSTDDTLNQKSDVVIQSIKTGTRTVLVRGGSAPRYLPTGHLVYVVDGTLYGVRFDPTIPVVSGAATPLVNGIVRGFNSTNGSGNPQYAISDSGTLVYQVVSNDPLPRRLVWIDRQGTETPFSGAQFDRAIDPQFSPDGTRLALRVAGGDLWVYFLDGKPPIKLVPATVGNIYDHTWAPDGLSLAFPAGAVGVFQIRADGSETSPRRISSVGNYYPRGWSADGKKFLTVVYSSTGYDIVQWPVDDYTKAEPIVQTPADEGSGLGGARLSPDGRWLAYTSNQTGQMEIWVRPYPGPGAPQRVSANGGRLIRWGKQGRELYFIEGSGVNQRMMAVNVQAGATFNFETPQPLFNFRDDNGYDVAADGRFLVLRNPETAAVTDPERIVVVENWFEEVKRLLPAEKK